MGALTLPISAPYYSADETQRRRREDRLVFFLTMCCSFIGQIIFGAVMLATLGLTLAAMFTPGWRDFENTQVSAGKLPKASGLFPFLCKMPGSEGSAAGVAEGKADDYCRDWWNSITPYEQAVIAAICAAALLEIIACVWTVISLCACCCKSFILHPLPAFAAVITAFLAVAVILYGVKYKDSIGLPSSIKEVTESSQIGYSFYLACGALGGAFIDIIVGVCCVALASRCL